MANNPNKHLKATNSCCYQGNSRLYFLTALVLAVISLTLWISGCNSKLVKRADSTNDPAKDFNVQVPISDENIGNLNNVPKEELDSLFSNLKQ
jgi:hypothetical protein